MAHDAVGGEGGGDAVGSEAGVAGEDGADGMGIIRAGGGITIAESESSCVVYGMPRAAIRRGAATWVLALPEIAHLLSGLE